MKGMHGPGFLKLLSPITYRRQVALKGELVAMVACTDG